MSAVITKQVSGRARLLKQNNIDGVMFLVTRLRKLFKWLNSHYMKLMRRKQQ